MTTVPPVGDLEGIRVALLRSPERAGPMSAELSARGAQPFVVPLIDFELPADSGALDRALAGAAAGNFSWMVVTSATTVSALAMRVSSMGGTLGNLLAGSVRIAAVGRATAAALAASGLEASLVADGESSSSALAEIFPTGVPAAGGDVLLPQADIADDTLLRLLSDRGWTVQRVEAYRTVDYPADPTRRISPPASGTGGEQPVVGRREFLRRVAAGTVDVVVVTSPSITARLGSLCGTLPPSVGIVAIGKTTAEAARHAGQAPVQIAAAPTPAGVAEAVRQAQLSRQ